MIARRPATHAGRAGCPSPADSVRERGQTTTEYLMIAGLLTAMLISLTTIIVPTMKLVGVRVVQQMVVQLSSPPMDEEKPPQACPEFVEPEEGVDCQ